MISPETFCDGVKEAFIANLPAALQAQTDAWAAADLAAGRNVSLKMPRDEDVAIGGVTLITRYPTLELAVSDMSFGGLSLGNEDGDATPRLHIKASFQDAAASSEELYRAGCRWFAAIMSVAAVEGVFGEVSIDSERGVQAAWRFNPQTNETDEVQSFVLATFNLSGPLSPFFA